MEADDHADGDAGGREYDTAGWPSSYYYYLLLDVRAGVGGRDWQRFHAMQERRRTARDRAAATARLTKLSALVVMPPQEQWTPLLAVKARHMAPHVRRPPYPHITLASPFVPDDAFGDAEARLRRVLTSAPPFDVHLRRFDFLHQRKASTLIIVPECEPADGMHRLFDALLSAFPECADQAPLMAHLTMGHFEDKDEAERMREQYQREWKEMRFTVREVHLMSRTETGPFASRKAVPLGSCRSGQP